MASGSANVSYITQLGGPLNTATSGFNVPLNALTNVISFMAGNGSTVSNGFYNFWSGSSPASTTQYQVPNGKTLCLVGYYLQTTGSERYMFGYGTAAAASEGTTTAPTGAVYYAPSSTTYLLIGTSSSVQTWVQICMTFPANSYPFIKTESAAAFRANLYGVNI